MKKLIVAFVVLAGLATAGWITYGNLHRGPTNRLLVSGNIELTQVDIAFKTAGRLTDLYVGEGDAVKKGQIVARLDRDQLLRQREREQAALASAEAMLAEAGSAWRYQQATTAADLEVRHAEINSANFKLKELKNGSRPQEVQEAQDAVAAAQAEYDRSKKDWDRAQVLIKNDDISTSQFDEFRHRFDAADANLKQTKEHSALVSAGPRSEQIDEAGAQVSRAQAQLKLGEANQIETERRQQEVTMREAEIARSRAQIALIDAQLADTIAISPIDGVVLVKAADPGEILAPGTSIVTVGDIDHPWLRAYVGESDLGKIKLGDKLKVTTDSYPGKVYDGHLTFISPEAEFTPKQIQTSEERVKLVYRIKIEIDNPRHELKSNMPADAELALGN
jgi:HlyD family secretion protein